MKQTLAAAALLLGLALTVHADDADAAGFGQAGYTPHDLAQADDQIAEAKFKKYRAAGVRKGSCLAEHSREWHKALFCNEKQVLEKFQTF